MNAQTMTALFAWCEAKLGVSRHNRRDEFIAITEGRDNWTPQNYCPGGLAPNSEGQCGYSWCGDFVTAALFAVGVRDGSLLNRKEVNGKWIAGQNLTMIENWAKTYGLWKKFSQAAGPCIYIKTRTNGDHIGFVQAVGNGRSDTYDGNSIGGAVARQHIELSDKTVRGVLELANIPVPAEQGAGTPSVPGFPGLPPELGGVPISTLPSPTAAWSQLSTLAAQLGLLLPLLTAGAPNMPPPPWPQPSQVLIPGLPVPVGIPVNWWELPTAPQPPMMWDYIWTMPKQAPPPELGSIVAAMNPGLIAAPAAWPAVAAPLLGWLGQVAEPRLFSILMGRDSDPIPGGADGLVLHDLSEAANLLPQQLISTPFVG